MRGQSRLAKKSLKSTGKAPVEDGRLLRQVVAASDSTCVVTGQDGVISAIYGEFARITGLGTTEGLVGLPATDIIKALDVRDLDGEPVMEGVQLADAVRSIMAAGKQMRLQNMTMRADGALIRLESYFPGDGTLLSVMRDMSDVAEDRAMLRYAMETASAGYWSLDMRTGEFKFSDSVNRRLSQGERSRIATDGLFAILHPDDRSRLLREWQAVATGLGPFDLTYRVVTEAEGTMWQRSIGEVQTLPDGTRIKATAFVMEITDAVQAREDLERAQDDAARKEDFMARMSHEIRTPLNAIIGMADSLQDEPMSDTVRDVVGDMEAAAENLSQLLTHTLDHAKLSTGTVKADFEPNDPRKLVQSCLRTWRAKMAEKGLEFRIGVSPDVPDTMPLDSFRVRQCLDNLLSNAAKFTEEGRVVLVARAVQHEGQPHLALIVQDSGIGMSAEEQRNIFDPYNQADGTISRRFGGTGLGLSISRQLAVLMGGTLTVRSTPGQGSAFVLMLPLDPDAALAAQAAAQSVIPAVAVANDLAPEGAGPKSAPDSPVIPAPARLPFEGLSVLCVEDNVVNQKVVERLIGSRVAQLHFASHGREALSVLDTVHIDVVLMDIHMPVMDGIETTMEIRGSEATYANVIIIALTADPDYQQMRICRNIGMNDTIAKPVRREDILEAFNRTMGNLSESHGVKVALG